LNQFYGTSIAVNYTLIAALGELRIRAYDPANSLAVEIALLVYDSLLTIAPEIGYIWKTKFKLGTALYLLARYPLLLYHSLQIILALSNISSLQVCFFRQLSFVH
jgi:Family of unknown function (DUF6533)